MKYLLLNLKRDKKKEINRNALSQYAGHIWAVATVIAFKKSSTEGLN